MDSELRRLIDGVAEVVLGKIRGSGYWKKFGSEDKEIDEGDPVEDLKVGDVVYMYDTDVMELTSHTVVNVIDNVGYRLHKTRPILSAVLIDFGYAKTVRDAIELCWDEIQDDIAGADRLIEKRKKLIELIEQHRLPETKAND